MPRIPGSWASALVYVKVLPSLKRWPQFRATAPSESWQRLPHFCTESCSRCSAGGIISSAMPRH
eukprot:2672645-Pyramimonas_sp.AAC.1